MHRVVGARWRQWAAVVVLWSAVATAQGATVASGPIAAEITPTPLRIDFRDATGLVLRQATGGAIGYRDATGWHAAIAAQDVRTDRHGIALRAVFDDPTRTMSVRITPAGDGILAIDATWDSAPAGIFALGAAFDSPGDEHFYGFGERANATEHRGASVESFVADGPWTEDDRALISALLPKVGFRARDDSTYFPVPWLLSSRGYGVLVDNDETVYHHLATATAPTEWRFEVVGAPDGFPARPAPANLRFRVFSGPTPAAALQRFSAAVGRQPPSAAPWIFGPWYQGPALQAFRDGDVPVSVSQTYHHYLPCGGDRSEEPPRAAAAHALGYAITAYFNPMLCTSLQPAFNRAATDGALTTTPAGAPYVYSYFTTRFFDVGQIDFSAAAGRRHYGDLLHDAIEDGFDGWMEDFGEYTPLDSVSADGRDGSATHNRYPTDYHCAAYAFAERQARPLARFQRSGWTGAARCAQVVWGGDPTTSWDFDGLASAVKTGLSLGLSGVSRFGSDIGGFFGLFGKQLTGELLTRWVQVGAVSGVMRTQRTGTSIPAYTRPQVEDPDQLANWRRYAKLRTQLYPYIDAADRTYRRTGLPVMRHLLLTYPDDANASARDDEFLFGPDLLAAPVLTPGTTARAVYLPAGEWIDFWRAVAYQPADGSLSLGRAALTAGNTAVTVPAPLDELPLFACAGAVFVLLPADVDTLTDFGDGAGGVVRLTDRRDQRHVLAFPRGDSSDRFERRGRYQSTDAPGRWMLRLRGERRTTWSIEASLATLRTPFVPACVMVNGRVLETAAWDYDAGSGVLRVRTTGRTVRIEARAVCSATATALP